MPVSELKQPKLGPRERDLLRLLLTGCSNAEMAGKLGIKTRTVKAHFNRLFIKFRIEGGIKRVKLAVIAYRARQELGLED